jgi:hypothetical protein
MYNAYIENEKTWLYIKNIQSMYIYYMGHHYYRRNSLNNLHMIEFQIIYYEFLLQNAITTHDWSCSDLLSLNEIRTHTFDTLLHESLSLMSITNSYM